MAYKRLNTKEYKDIVLNFYIHHTVGEEYIKVPVRKEDTGFDVLDTIDRYLEDHENVASVVYEQSKLFSGSYRWFYQKSTEKYKFFDSPREFYAPFPSVRVEFEDPNIPWDEEICTLENLANNDDLNLSIIYSSPMAILTKRTLPKKNRQWEQKYMLLRNGCLYQFDDQITLRIYSRMERIEFDRLVASPESEARYILNVRYWEFFLCWGVRTDSTCNYGVLFKPTVVYNETSSGKIEAKAAEKGVLLKHVRVICFVGHDLRTSWTCAMRLAKYGKQLRENYRVFKRKQAIPVPGRPEHDEEPTHVPMTFREGGFQIDKPGDEDIPELADLSLGRYIARGALYGPNQSFAIPKQFATLVNMHHREVWYHARLSRDDAGEIVARYGDGYYLIRESASNPASFVLTHKVADKIYHTPICYVMHPEKRRRYLSLDNGQTYFCDLLSLIEFYTLNAGSLPATLKQFVPNPLNSATTAGGPTSPLRMETSE